MIQTIRFFAHGVPKGQPRPKAFSRGGIASVYDPGTAEGWKGQVALAARPFIPAAPLEGFIYLGLEFFFPRPKSHYRTGKRAGELREDAPFYCDKKPDFDNAAKAVADALTVIRMWRDDAQVVESIVRKYYANKSTGCLIEIKEA